MPLLSPGGAARRRAGRLACLLLGACLAACDRGEPAGAPDASEVLAQRLGLSATVLPAPLPRPDFVLTDTEGRRYDFRGATAGRLTLLYFGYTSCPDVCPAQLGSLAAGLRQLPAVLRDQVAVVFVGVDAARDTRERVRSWLAHFDPHFVGLTGSEEELAAAERAAMVPTAFVDDRWEGGYTVAHASWVMVYTPDDQAHLRYGVGTSAEQWAHDLGVLTQEGWPLAPARGEAQAAPGGIAVSAARIPEPAGDVAALYLVVRGEESRGDRLLGARSDVGEAQLHETREQGGLVQMTRVRDGLEVPANGELRLQPGGAHIMLTGLREPLALGSRVRVTLEFERAGPRVVEAPVVPAEQAARIADGDAGDARQRR
jgi:protein SCO1/2